MQKFTFDPTNWAIIDPQNIRQAPLQAKSFKNSNQALAGDRSVNLDMDCLTVEVINHVKGAKPLAGIEHIAHKVSRPNLVGAWRYQQGLFDPLRQPLLGPALLVQFKVAG